MSKQLVDNLIKEFLTSPRYKRRWDTVLRSEMGGFPHITRITKEDLVTLYRDNTIAALYGEKTFKEASDAASRVKGIEEAALSVADSVFSNFSTYYDSTTGKRKGSVFKEGDAIVIRQPAGLHSSIKRIIWQKGWAGMSTSPALSERSRRQLKSEEGKRIFRRRTQDLHEEMTTVGTFTLGKLYQNLLEHVVDTDFTVAETTTIAKTIKDYFGPVFADWSKFTKMTDKGLEDELFIPLTIGPQSINPAGSEAYDWKQIRARLEQAIRDEAVKGNLDIKYATTEGSKPLTQKVQERALHSIADKLKNSFKKSKTVTAKVSQLPKEDKKSVRYRGKSSDGAKAIGLKKKGVSRKSYSTAVTSKKKPEKPKMALANILGILNNQLPRVVARNMGSPRLENRTGRFAQSVRATEITETPQGFPSIGYTYMKERYGGYESTSGSRFADIDRDPRPLIDQSIREIVMGFALGRLYTRRQ